MRVDIENMLRQIGESASRKFGYQYMLSEFSKNLRELRDRTERGDMAALDEFFKIYVFSDLKDYARAAQETPDECECIAHETELADGTHSKKCFLCKRPV